MAVSGNNSNLLGLIGGAVNADTSADYESITLSPVGGKTKPVSPTPVYATHCLVDLPKWQRKLRQWSGGATPKPEVTLARAALLQELAERLASTPSPLLPEIVVLAWNDQDSTIVTHYAIVDDIIFLNKSLSEDWTHGRESDLALQTLIHAIDNVRSAKEGAAAIKI